MKAINVTTSEVLSNNLVLADTLISRMKGLLGRDSMPADMALWIRPCNGVHTFGMKFSIDVMYLDKDCNVIAMKKDLRPNKMTRLYLKSSSVLELPAGALDATSTKIGDVINIG